MKQRSLYFLLASVCFGSHQAYSASKLLVKRWRRGMSDQVFDGGPIMIFDGLGDVSTEAK